MDFKLAIRQHVDWRRRLYNMVNGRHKESLDVSAVSVDNRCILGQWIYGDGMEKYSDNKHFQNLIEHHKDFHNSLGNLVSRFQAGEDIELEKELGLGGSFDNTSMEVVKDVLMLQKIMEREANEHIS